MCFCRDNRAKQRWEHIFILMHVHSYLLRCFGLEREIASSDYPLMTYPVVAHSAWVLFCVWPSALDS